MPKRVIVHAPYDVRLEEIPLIQQPLGNFELLVHAEVAALSPRVYRYILDLMATRRIDLTPLVTFR